ncbi:hypothetical protein [Paramaledivibacter caminithermalis]|uniref:Lipoprotein n=1 Tax=Paramaledivibacter caminithermalis (strain DSM 15212 / CIP 107654 / DViRD3) TaxID=1121301 RepID=A0A1M6JPY2_PARC5|nr:hypothetical protein [Paramaledivibacter caminithermalis]SHJ48706.1 hypothetical protein SAMN02745912_00087 [Paramaledivibacter caminithermalis DSM 15212]
MSKIKFIIIFLAIGLCSCATINIDKIETDENMSNIDIELFMNIDKLAIDFIELEEIEGDELKSYSIKENYDFDCDGKKDLVNFLIKFRGSRLNKSVLQINDSFIEYEFHNPYEIYVIDLDTKDKFVEFTIHDDGPSGDSSFTFFRYTGKKILLLGQVTGYPKLDGNGHMITSSANFVSPAIIFEIAEVTGSNIIYTVIDHTKYLNKEYKVCYDFNAYFKEYDTIPKNFMPAYDIEETLIAKDSIIKIKHIELEGSVPCWYEVELDDGINGILYFWLGD